MVILLLGGTSDAIQLAKQLIALNVELIYSIAGLVRQPKLNCKIHSGGFQGELAKYLRNHHIDLLIDATHPYAINISQQAKQAANEIGIEHWLYNRPAWQKTATDNWNEFSNWDDLLTKVQAYQTPLFTLGQKTLEHLNDIPQQQFWTVRTAVKNKVSHPRLRIITAIGGFSLDEEARLFKQYNIDVLICKNSGGTLVSSKLLLARQLSIPVIMQTRPVIVTTGKIFTVLEEIVYKIKERQKSTLQ